MSLNHAVCWAFFPSLRKYSFLNQVAQGSESFNGVKSYNKNALLALLPGAKQAKSAQVYFPLCSNVVEPQQHQQFSFL